MLGPLLFAYKGFKGFLVIFFVLQKKFITVKKNSPKKYFLQKKIFTKSKFEKCEAKKMH